MIGDAGETPSLHLLYSEPLGTDVVERLEEVLEKARAGEISSVAIAVVDRTGTTRHNYSGMPSLALMLGSISRLAHALNLKQDRINAAEE